jgi:hypothetical protein
MTQKEKIKELEAKCSALIIMIISTLAALVVIINHAS